MEAHGVVEDRDFGCSCDASPPFDVTQSVINKESVAIIEDFVLVSVVPHEFVG